MSGIDVANCELRIVNPFRKSVRIEITGHEYKETIIAGPKETVTISLDSDTYNIDAWAIESGIRRIGNGELEWRHERHQDIQNLPKASEPVRSLSEMLREMEEEAKCN